MTDVFQNIQFIVTTHSPFIPQTVDNNKYSTVHLLKRNARNSVEAIPQEGQYHLWQSDQILLGLYGLTSTFSYDKSQVIESYYKKYQEMINKQVLGEAKEPISNMEPTEFEEAERFLLEHDLETDEIYELQEMLEEVVARIENLKRVYRGAQHDSGKA